MKGTPQQFKAMLLKQGVRPDEMKWSGYDDALGGRPAVTRDDIVKHFRERMPKVSETTLSDRAIRTPTQVQDDGRRLAAESGDDWEHLGPNGRQRYLDTASRPRAKYAGYQLPGGENYRETLLHYEPHVDKTKIPPTWRTRQVSDNSHVVYDESKPSELLGYGHTPLMAMNQALAENGVDSKAQEWYRSSHWDQPNVLAHLRLSDRTGPQDEHILHLEELQSDWAQEARKKGFYGSLAPADEAERAHLRQRQLQPDYNRAEILRHAALNMKEVLGVPSAPYVDSTAKWMDLGLKRLLREAATGGYDRIVVTPGEEQARRYDLSQHVDKLTWDQMNKVVHADRKGEKTTSIPVADHNALAGVVGKEIAERLKTAPIDRNLGMRVLKGNDLKIGGEGMKAFYDQMLPRALEKLAQRHDPGVRVEPHDLATNKSGWHIIDPKTSIDGKWIVKSSDYNSTGKRFESEAAAKKYLDTKAEKTPVHSLKFTPKMRNSVLRGMPAYAEGGLVSSAETVQLPRRAKLQKAAGGSVDHDPTEAQKAAGNYAKRRLSFQGLPVTIENDMGSVRSGRGPDGKAWQSVLPAHYGYIRRTEGADGDHVDVYVGPKKDSNLAVVVNQHHLGKAKNFDEHKIILGARSEREAIDIYCKGFSDGRGKNRIGSVEVMSIDGLKRWLKKGRTTSPVKAADIVSRAMQLVQS